MNAACSPEEHHALDLHAVLTLRRNAPRPIRDLKNTIIEA